MPAIGEKAIATELRAIRKEPEYIRRHIVDVYMVLTPDEAKRPARRTTSPLPTSW